MSIWEKSGNLGHVYFFLRPSKRNFSTWIDFRPKITPFRLRTMSAIQNDFRSKIVHFSTDFSFWSTFVGICET